MKHLAWKLAAAFGIAALILRSERRHFGPRLRLVAEAVDGQLYRQGAVVKLTPEEVAENDEIDFDPPVRAQA